MHPPPTRLMYAVLIMTSRISIAPTLWGLAMASAVMPSVTGCMMHIFIVLTLGVANKYNEYEGE